MERGNAKIEFFSNYDYIQDLYYKKGLVVAKRLYEILQNEEKITMSYKQFNTYFQEFIFKKDERFFSSGVKEKDKTKVKNNLVENEDLTNKIFETPKVKKIIVGGDKKKKFYNPHTVNINEEDIL
jgi:hypothetical protein